MRYTGNVKFSEKLHGVIRDVRSCIVMMKSLSSPIKLWPFGDDHAIVKTLPYEILNTLLRLRNVICRSSWTLTEAVLILTSVTAEAVTPGQLRSSLKSLNHPNTVSRGSASSPYDCCSFS